MADNKQHLNGAYYGPSIPPTQSYHRPGRGGGCGCFGFLFNLIFKIVLTVIVIVGILALVFWLIFRPNMLKFHVTEASLTEFTHTNNTLYYNLNLTMQIRNPNKHIGIYYDRIEANAYYKDQRFSTVTLTPFYQGHKNTSVLEPVFKGQSLVMLGSSETTEFNSEKASGTYSIDMKLRLKIRFKLRSIKTHKFKPKIDCDLKLPLNSDGTVHTTYQTSKCDFDFK